MHLISPTSLRILSFHMCTIDIVDHQVFNRLTCLEELTFVDVSCRSWGWLCSLRLPTLDNLQFICCSNLMDSHLNFENFPNLTSLTASCSCSSRCIKLSGEFVHRLGILPKLNWLTLDSFQDAHMHILVQLPLENLVLANFFYRSFVGSLLLSDLRTLRRLTLFHATVDPRWLFSQLSRSQLIEFEWVYVAETDSGDIKLLSELFAKHETLRSLRVRKCRCSICSKE